MSEPVAEKKPESASSPSFWSTLSSNAFVSRASSLVAAFQQKREDLALPNPSGADNLFKEVERDVLLNNYAFTGLRADLTRALSAMNPLFQVSHSFTMGSQTQPPYQFAVMYGSPLVFMQGMVDNDRNVYAKFNAKLIDNLITRAAVSPGPDQSMFSIENEWTGRDFTANIKALNPSILQGGLTGTVVADYMQSVTPALALGLQTQWARMALNDGPQLMTTYMARYKTPTWIAMGRVAPQMGLELGYWRRLAQKVEVGAYLEVRSADMMGGGVMGGAPKMDGTATVGAKYDFRTGALRGQVDSKGKIGVHWDKRVAPMVSLTFHGSIDHPKSEAKVGLGISIEATSETAMAQMEAAQADPESMQQPPF